jgi:acetyltransferase-like isoleucine patch superfamily enzyme
MNLSAVFHLCKHLNVKTIYFNLKYFPFKIGRRLPVFISSQVLLKTCKGIIELPELIHTGMIKIGFGEVGIFDKKKSRSIWEVNGQVFFKGSANIGHGSKISVGKDGVLTIGNNFDITAQSSIVCFHKVTIGNNCLFSWEVLLMDTDFHTITKNNERINDDAPIILADHIWVGTRAIILKGANIASGTIVAAGALVNKVYETPNVILGGVPAKVVNENIEWK